MPASRRIVGSLYVQLGEIEEVALNLLLLHNIATQLTLTLILYSLKCEFSYHLNFLLLYNLFSIILSYMYKIIHI